MDETLKQTTGNLLMVRPANFGFNEQTAESNTFQKKDPSLSADLIKLNALKEFDAFVAVLTDNGIKVHVLEDTANPVKPDAIFPNNWVTFHQNGAVITYPMYAPARRPERRSDIIEYLKSHFITKREHHLEFFEAKNKFLEGTGSMILDRINKIVYACISPRTDASLLEEFCLMTDYEKVQFSAVDEEGKDIYHTNVMMAIGETFVVICLDSIKSEKEREILLNSFSKTNKKIIEITFDQVLAFAGNMLHVRNDKEDTFLVMSEQAYLSLTEAQIRQISKHTDIIYSPINTIETYGGGSARCMMAEIFLAERENGTDH
ncbi:MAG: hypothetical protein ACI8P3_003640 [Saprospiraceae bacterium]